MPVAPYVPLGLAMSESLKSALRIAVLRILEPLARWLLDAGLGVGDFQSLVKIAFVRAAREQMRDTGDSGSRPNVSRIAVLTGLTRVDVNSILAGPEAAQSSDRGRQRAERVLAGWWNDSAFRDAQGNPAILAVRGRGRSFANLVDRYSGERLLAGSILEALLRVKAVRRRPDGKLQAISRTYATVRWDPEGVIAMGQQVKEHLETLVHNLRHPAQATYVGRIVNVQVDPRYIPMLLRDVQDEAEGLVQTTDTTINSPSYTLRGRAGDTGAVSLGLSVYVFHRPSDQNGDGDGEEGGRGIGESNTRTLKQPSAGKR
jgi:hypothetical protein